MRTLHPSVVRRLFADSLKFRRPSREAHVLLCLADHYEPCHGGASFERGLGRVKRWTDNYTQHLGMFRDADGCPPKHTFFYPLEEYVEPYLAALEPLCREGFGEVEVHLHHHDDSSANTRRQLLEGKALLRSRHGFLADDADGNIVYGFIHGNYALDNSRPDATRCGVNDELTILRETGCYADFTLPSAPDPTQTRTINAIYFAADDPDRPKSHDVGVPARVGQRPPADTLLMIQGPLAFNWRRRKWGMMPRLENAELLHNNPPTLSRLEIALHAHVHVTGRPEWIFVKLHTHGAIEPNADMLFSDATRRFHRELQRFVADAEMSLHYVTAREMANIALAAVDGHTGNPHAFRDYRYRWPV